MSWVISQLLQVFHMKSKFCSITKKILMRALPRTVADLHTTLYYDFCATFQQLFHITWLLVLLVCISIHLLYCRKKIIRHYFSLNFRSSLWMLKTDVLIFTLNQVKDELEHFRLHLPSHSHSLFFHLPETNNRKILVHICI